MTLIYVGNNSTQSQLFAFNASGQIRRTSDNTWQSVPASSTATTNYKITVAGIDGIGAHYVDTANLPADWTRLELRTIGGTDTFANATLRAVTTDAGITVAPILATSNQTRYTVKDMAPIVAGSGPADQWTITDSTGAAASQAGDTIRFVVAAIEYATLNADPFSDDFTAAWTRQTGGDGVVISGASNNIITVTQDPADVVAGEYVYWLLNITDRIVLATGKLPVKPIVAGAWT